MNLGKAILPIVLSIGLSLSLVIVLVLVASSRPLQHLEAVLLELVILSSGVVASYLIGRRATKLAVKPQASSALLRIVNLYSGLFYIKNVINRRETTDANTAHVIDIIEAVVDQQVRTVADAMEDWRAIIPEDVDELKRQLTERDPRELEDLKR